MAEAQPERGEAERIDAILERMAEGESLRAACRAEGIAKTTLFRRTEADPVLQDHYARARRWQGHAHFDRVVEVARWVEEQATAGAITSEQVQAMRAAIDAHKWAAAKLHPDYSDRIDVRSQVTHSHVLAPVPAELSGALRTLGIRAARGLAPITLEAEASTDGNESPETPPTGPGGNEGT